MRNKQECLTRKDGYAVRILFVNDSLVGGGAERLLNDLLPMINEDNYCELLILTDENQKYLNSLQKAGIKVTVMPANRKNHLSKAKFITDYIKKSHFDIVHANLFPVLYYCSFSARKLKANTKFVYTEHNTDNRRRHIKLLRPVEKLVYKPYVKVISISNQTQEKLVSWLKPKKENLSKFIVIDNGVNLEAFQKAEAYDKSQFIGQHDSNTIVLGMIGSFTEQKNHEFILEVMQKLPSSYHLILVGEGPLEEKIKNKIQVEKIDDRVHLCGFRSDVASIIKTCDLVVIPSKWEGFGLIAVEAMCCGKRIVCSDIPGLSDVVGDAGTKCSIEDACEFAKAIISEAAYIKDKKKIETCYKRAEKFDIKNMKEGYLQLYESILENTK